MSAALREPRTANLPAWWVEALIVAAGYLLYQLIQSLLAGSPESAIDRAIWIWHLEQNLHINPELIVNGFFAERQWIVVAAGLFYSTCHFLLTPAVLVWLRFFRQDVYVPLRNTLIGTSLVALAMYWLVPLAPPRLALPGIVDTSVTANIMSAASPSWPATWANQYAAMPSLHVAWAVWVALALVVAFRGSPYRQLAWIYPSLTTIVVVGTGNHFVVDAVAGAAIVFGCWAALVVIPDHLDGGDRRGLRSVRVRTRVASSAPIALE